MVGFAGLSCMDGGRDVKKPYNILVEPTVGGYGLLCNLCVPWL